MYGISKMQLNFAVCGIMKFTIKSIYRLSFNGSSLVEVPLAEWYPQEA